MLYSFVTSVCALLPNPIIDPIDWCNNHDVYTAPLTISSVIYILPLSFQYLFLKNKKIEKKTHWRECVTIPNILFAVLIVSFVILSLVVWYRGATVGFIDPTGHGGADIRLFRNDLLSYAADMIVPIILTIMGIILSIAQYFQLRSSSVKNKSVKALHT